MSSWLDARREQELFQAVGRARLYDTVDGACQLELGLFERENDKKLACTVYAFTNVPIPGLEVDEYVSFIGKGLKERRAVNLTRIASLVQAILQLRERKEKLTQVGLARLAGLSPKMVRRLYLAALAQVEQMGSPKVARISPEPLRPPAAPALQLAAPLLETRVALPPPVGATA